MTPVARSASPAWLAVAILLGAALGAWSPTRLTWLGAAAQAGIALLNMVGLPMLVICIWSGLRQWPAQPRALPRLAWLAAGSLLAMPIAAGLGGALAMLTSAGTGFGSQAIAMLGVRALEVEPIAAVVLLGVGESQPMAWPWDWLVPNSLYRALAYGTLASALAGVVVFGMGLAVQDTERSRAFVGLVQGIYRSLEVLVERAKSWLPFFAFALSASVVHHVGLDLLARMRAFLLPFALATLVAAAFAVAVTSLRLRVPVTRVLGALQETFVLCLFSTGPAVAVPSLIDGLCNRLGFRRDLMELSAPLLPTFVRLGDALFFGVLLVFTANLYARPLDATDLPLVAAAAGFAALAGVALSSGWVLATAGLMLGWFELPFEALLPTFVLLEALTAGLRNLVSTLVVAPLVALVASDLISRQTEDPAAKRAVAAQVKVFLTGRQALALVILLTFALFTAGLAGLGVGLNEDAHRDLPRPATGFSRPQAFTVVPA